MADRRRGDSRGLALLALVAGLIIGLAAGVVFFDADDDDLEPVEAENAVVEPLSVGAVTDEPGDYFGEDLWLAGIVADVIGPRSLVLEGTGDEPQDELLVVTERPLAMAGDAGPATRPLLQSDRIWVRGELRTLDVAELERRLGAELEDDVSDREGDPVLVADDIQLTAQLYPVIGTVRATDIADRPAAFFGELGVIEGEVTRHAGSEALVLDGRLLVLNTTGDALPDIGTEVAVLGPVRRFDLDQLPGTRRDDFDDDLFGEFIDEPVVVAYNFRKPR